jgi:hypothetical protein
MRPPSPKQAVGRLWHKRVDLGQGAQSSSVGPQGVEATQDRESSEPETPDQAASEPEEGALG